MDKDTLKMIGWWIIGSLLILAGVIVFLIQGYLWLKEGVWHPQSLQTTLCDLGGECYPTEWIGFHKILDFIPLSLALIILGIISFNLQQE